MISANLLRDEELVDLIAEWKVGIPLTRVLTASIIRIS